MNRLPDFSKASHYHAVRAAGMEFIDLGRQQRRIAHKIESVVRKVLREGKYIMGPEVYALEESLRDYVGTKYAVSCSSGTDALLMSLMAYNIGPGDAVFTTPFTFFATAEAISLVRARPVFVDIDSSTFNIDPEKLDQTISDLLLRRSNDDAPLPKAVIAVDLFGLPADYERIKTVVDKHGLVLIEDAAQSFGAEYNQRRAGSFGDIACTSFFPAKPLGCYGDGGMCFTNDVKIEAVLKSLRVHGQGEDKYDNVRFGLNGRLDTLQAAILLAKFEIFPEEFDIRQNVAMNYSRLLSSIPELTTPSVPQNCRSAWAQYSILAKDIRHRQLILEALTDAGIPTAVYYPKPLHLQQAFSFLAHQRGDFPVSEYVAERIFSIPMHPYLEKGEQEKIAEVIGSMESFSAARDE